MVGNKMCVVKLHNGLQNTAAEFAAEELSKYLGRMMPGLCITVAEGDVKETSGVVRDNGRWDKGARDKGTGAPSRISSTGVLALGLYDDLNIPLDGIRNRGLDDAVFIDVSGLNGIIAGSNGRSILFGVYRFLEEAGCRWVRHGQDGEYIPERDLFNVAVKIDEKASYRHRGMCIEGAVSFENMLDNIDWAPKLGFNSYFIEFFTPFTFFERWYSHKNNKYKKPEPLTVDRVKEFTKEMEKEIKKRGMNYHAVGHAWTCECLGIPGLTWEPGEYRIDESISRLFAQLDGDRKMYEGVPIKTNLCYSNPEARKLIVDYIAGYLEENRHVDMLHFWLADGMNNHCECESCIDTRPSDFYVMMLNELNEELNSRDIDTRIVFLVYEDLLWAPVSEKIKNTDRFILLFAPITRTYSRPYETDTEGVELLPYRKNKLLLPAGIRENVAYLKEWKKGFSGDAIAYEYHFMWDHYNDPGYYKMAEILSRDIKKLKYIGVDGMISDQTQRSFFPTGFGMYVMGKTLWNDGLDFAKTAERYFTDTFGEDGMLCMKYMERLSELFDPVYMRGEKSVAKKEKVRDFNLWKIQGDVVEIDPEIPARLGKIPGVIRDFRPVIKSNKACSDPCMAKSWEYLEYHGDIMALLAEALLAKEHNDGRKAKELWEMTVDTVQRYEDRIQPVLDVFEFIFTLESKFK